MADVGWKRMGVETESIHRSADPFGVFCGTEGPRIGPIALLRKTATGFVPRSGTELDLIFTSVGYPIRFEQKESSLKAIADALNKRDNAHAWFTMTFMRLPRIPNGATYQRLLRAEALLKASPDDANHPGWPAGTPDGLGGKFRPKTALELNSSPSKGINKARKKALRQAIRGRLLLHIKSFDHAEDEAQEKLDAFEGNSPLLLDDVAQLAVQAKELEMLAHVATEFAQKGPASLEELFVSLENESFRSYNEFKKYELEESLEKRFGPAGEGRQYHHIVEQNTNKNIIRESLLQSTRNIVKIPTLFHEAISAIYSRPAPEDSTVTLRERLKTKSFEEQHEYGLKVLRRLGILRRR